MRKRNKLYKLYTVSTKVKPNVFCYDCNKKLSCRWQTHDALVLMQWRIALLRSAWKKNSILRIRLFKITQGYWNRHGLIRHLWFPTAFYSNFIRKKHRFWDIRLQKCCDFEIWVRSPSLKMPPFDRAHMTSYWRSIVTMALSRACRFWDIQCRKLSWPWNPDQRSLKVIESGAIR